MTDNLRIRQINRGLVRRTDDKGYRLILESSPKKDYSLAQIDDYMDLHRYKFPHKPYVRLTLESQLSDRYTSGTWGFGFWNDPFGMGIGGGGRSRILPVLPNAAWFFFGSDENMLTLREDQPGNGFHVKTYRSPLLPSFASLLALPLSPLFLWRKGAKFVRSLARVLVKEDGMKLDVNVEKWHSYCISCDQSKITFFVDDQSIFSTKIVPNGRLGIVIWIDNQYFRFDKLGKLDFGCLEIPKEHWMKVHNLIIENKS